MTPWTGIVLARARPGDEMQSKVPAYLHPVAGRPLLWHAVWALTQLDPAPGRVVVVSELPLLEELFEGLATPVEVVVAEGESLHRVESLPHSPDSRSVLLVDGAALLPLDTLRALRESGSGSWVAAGPTDACAAHLEWAHVPQLFRLPDPLHTPSGVLAAHDRLPDQFSGALVRDRQGLAAVTAQVRDRLVRRLMQGGVTFLLPESVVVDVDVRIGRDSVIYPGAVLEGQTTIGEETVVGPGCRILDSWVGSGVELKGWNYISHTSVRNRAILEPYVRRGFD